jgi:hypothetical protein
MLQLLGGVAVAGAVAAGATAFTATGLTNSAGSTQFVGGTISQTVTGTALSSIAYAYTDATDTTVDFITQTVTGTALSSIAYAYTDATDTTVDYITLTFADANADTKAVTAVGTLGNASTVTFTCTAVGVVNATALHGGAGAHPATTMVAYCAGTTATNLASLAVTV